jgi:hypothetical protein
MAEETVMLDLDAPDSVIASISELAGDVSDEEEIPTTFPAPVVFIGHGAGPCLFVDADEAPEMAGMDKVGVVFTSRPACR